MASLWMFAQSQTHALCEFQNVQCALALHPRRQQPALMGKSACGAPNDIDVTYDKVCMFCSIIVLQQPVELSEHLNPRQNPRMDDVGKSNGDRCLCKPLQLRVLGIAVPLLWADNRPTDATKRDLQQHVHRRNSPDVWGPWQPWCFCLIRREQHEAVECY